MVASGDLRGAEWGDIDLDAAEWRYTVTKTNTPHHLLASRGNPLQLEMLLQRVNQLLGQIQRAVETNLLPGTQVEPDGAVLQLG